MRRLFAGVELAKEDRWKWHEDRQGRVIHRPAKFKTHYANALYRIHGGARVRVAYWCRLCEEGVLLVDGSGDLVHQRATSLSPGS